MATDGNGNKVTGGKQAGASFVSYKPYGEILRTDSAGPDVFRYKYTGQEEDKETGLYYYKARYYDPILGRFLQADNQIDGSSPMGNDVYMYTEGNPIKYTDPTGHSVFSSWLSKNGLGFLNFNIAVSAAMQRAFYVSSARWNSIGAIAAILNPVGLIANAIGGAVLGGAGATLAGPTMLGIAAGAAILGSASVSLGPSAVFIANMAGLAIGSIGAVVVGSAGSLLSALGNIAALNGVPVAVLAYSIGMIAGATALVAGLIALGVASFLVMATLATALATVVVAIGCMPILLASAIVIGIGALGSVLSFWTLQAYIIGGLSKSKFNNINWSDKDAKVAACYTAAVQFGGLIAGTALLGADGFAVALGFDSYNVMMDRDFASLFGIPVDGNLLFGIYSVGNAGYYVSKRQYVKAAASIADIYFPASMMLKYGEGTRRTCGGSLK
ncbi:RHS repeat-associated core domain-containing protein [Leptospira langatensis]|nr:RHS repeat-associated core domain-containing protein [Leptospira langatensis]